MIQIKRESSSDEQWPTAASHFPRGLVQLSIRVLFGALLHRREEHSHLIVWISQMNPLVRKATENNDIIIKKIQNTYPAETVAQRVIKSC